MSSASCLHCFDLALLAGRQEGHLGSKKLIVGILCGSGVVTGALHVLELQFSTPLQDRLTFRHWLIQVVI